MEDKKLIVDESEIVIYFSIGIKSIGNGRKVTEIMVYLKIGVKVISYFEFIIF